MTRTQRQVLQLLADDIETDLVYSKGGGWWIGNEQTNGRLAMALIRQCFVTLDSCSSDDFQRYTINGSGRRALAGEKPYRDAQGRWFWTIGELMAAQERKAA